MECADLSALGIAVRILNRRDYSADSKALTSPRTPKAPHFFSGTMIKRLSESKALAQLRRLKNSYQRFLKANYEHAAQNCKTCTTPGACCTDEHWVNVRITRLEAVAIRRALEQTPRLTDVEKDDVYRRAKIAVVKYGLRATTTDLKQTYSCPLFDKRHGCLVHNRAKPAPCIQHACYEDWQDLPSEQLQARTEYRVAKLNESVYGNDWSLLPIPLWLGQVDPESGEG